MSFWELCVIGVVALLVLGPEKLPGAIRSVTQFISGIRQFGQQMKSELANEIRVHELHQKLKDAEEKGLLGLSADEIAALTELKNAAESVTNPYPTTPETPLISPEQSSSASPVTAATELPAATSSTTPVGHEQNKPL